MAAVLPSRYSLVCPIVTPLLTTPKFSCRGVSLSSLVSAPVQGSLLSPRLYMGTVLVSQRTLSFGYSESHDWCFPPRDFYSADIFPLMEVQGVTIPMVAEGKEVMLVEIRPNISSVLFHMIKK